MWYTFKMSLGLKVSRFYTNYLFSTFSSSIWGWKSEQICPANDICSSLGFVRFLIRKSDYCGKMFIFHWMRFDELKTENVNWSSVIVFSGRNKDESDRKGNSLFTVTQFQIWCLSESVKEDFDDSCCCVRLILPLKDPQWRRPFQYNCNI